MSSTTLSDNGPERVELEEESRAELQGPCSEVMHQPDSFVHEAARYPGLGAFLDVTVPFVRQALEVGEPILVALSGQKIEMLQDELGPAGDRVTFADMSEIGSNPARIIPAWLRFVEDRPTTETRVWGIGEPIGPDRSDAALVECQRHESLLNVAFADTPRFNLLCPYDTEALDSSVIEEAHCSHPLIRRQDAQSPSASYRGLEEAAAPFAVPLPPIPSAAAELSFHGNASLPVIRRFVEQHARSIGMHEVGDLTLVVNELVVNSLVHGGGSGILRMWSEEQWLFCEVSDQGRIDAPLAGRRPPAPGQYGGWGLWLANQLCELVQVRSFDHGSAVRILLRLP